MFRLLFLRLGEEAQRSGGCRGMRLWRWYATFRFSPLRQPRVLQKRHDKDGGTGRCAPLPGGVHRVPQFLLLRVESLLMC